MTTRPESQRSRLATIIQEGHVNKRTSDEIAGMVMGERIAESESARQVIRLRRALSEIVAIYIDPENRSDSIDSIMSDIAEKALKS